MSREFHVVIERDEEGYLVASVPSLPGCHTQAKSLDEVIERVQEAIALCLEVETEKRGDGDRGREPAENGSGYNHGASCVGTRRRVC